MRPWVICSTLAATLLLGVSPVLAQEPPASIGNVIYKPDTAELLIETREQTAVHIQRPLHNAARKEIEFLIPNSIVQPTPKVITATANPLVRTFTLEQRALGGTPAVRVVASLNSNAAYIPFAVTPTGTGLKMAVGEPRSRSIAYSAPQTLQPTGGGYRAIAGSAAPPAIKNYTPPIGTPSTMQFNAQTLGPKPATISTPKPVPQNVANPVKGGHIAGSAAAAGNTILTMLGPVSSDRYSVISDIFYEDDSLTVVSTQQPITIQRSFTLESPNRFVVDIAPAALQSRSLTRAIPLSNPGINTVRTGQLDDQTVRIVVQFDGPTLPVSLSQWEQNHVLKLNFNRAF